MHDLEIVEEGFWRAMHSVYVDACAKLPDELRTQLVAEHRASFDYFLTLLDAEILRVVPMPGPSDQPVLVIEGQGAGDDYFLLAAIEAERLSIDPEFISAGIAAQWDDAFARLTEGEDPHP